MCVCVCVNSVRGEAEGGGEEQGGGEEDRRAGGAVQAAGAEAASASRVSLPDARVQDERGDEGGP